MRLIDQGSAEELCCGLYHYLGESVRTASIARRLKRVGDSPPTLLASRGLAKGCGNLYNTPMPRWEHGSEERLKQAARELFDQQGFERTSVVEIAARARVTTRTFFRYFADKREVLFAGLDDLRAALIEKVLQVPDGAGPLQVVTGALAEFDWENIAPRRSQRTRHAIIAANPELLERDLIKQHGIMVGVIEALRQRGVDAETAQLAARVGIQVFLTAYQHWLEAGARPDVAAITDRMMSLLTTMVPTGAPLPASRRKKPRAASKKPRAAKQAKSTALRTGVVPRSKGGPRR